MLRSKTTRGWCAPAWENYKPPAHLQLRFEAVLPVARDAPSREDYGSPVHLWLRYHARLPVACDAYAREDYGPLRHLWSSTQKERQHLAKAQGPSQGREWQLGGAWFGGLELHV